MQPKYKKRLAIAMIVILLCSIFAMLLQTDFGKVQVEDIYFPTEGHQYLHALAFIPKNASADNKVPCVVTSHGFLNSAEVQDAASIELSRRGIMVIAMDAYNHGLSSRQADADPGISSVGMGMVSLVDYVTSGALEYVDLTRIGVMGHSMGGANTCATVMYYGRLYNEAIEAAKAPDSEGGAEITPEEQAAADAVNKISAALPTGVNPSSITDWNAVHCNLGILFGRLEETGSMTSVGTANILGASAEALALANSVDPSVTSVENGKFYGSIDEGNLRVLYQPLITHPLIHFSVRCTKDVIDFFTKCFKINTKLGVWNQTFLLKECINGVAMVALFSLLAPFCDFLLTIPCFASLRGEEGPKVPALTGERKKKWWLGWAICGAASFVFAVIAVNVTQGLFAVFGGVKHLFSATTMNGIMLWTLLSAIFCFIWFFANYKKDKAAGVRSDDMIGWKITGKEFWKSLLLAATIIGLIYAIVWFCKWAFNTDFRFWTPAVKTFNVEKLWPFLQYWPVFFAFYLVNSLFTNGANRVEGMSEGKNLFLCGLGNILGCGLMWLIEYGALVLTGRVVWGQFYWLICLSICFCIWQLFLAPYFLRSFYKLTGKNWVGAMVVSAMYVLCGVMHTAIS